MKKSFILTLVAISVFGTFAHAQKRRTPAKSKSAATEPAGPQPAPSYQDGQVIAEIICKGRPIPEGYVTAGETADGSCPNGAWLLKRKGTRSYVPTSAPTPVTASPSRRAPRPDRENDEETTEDVLDRRAAEINRQAERSNAITAAIRNRTILVGMTTDEVLQSWGRPYDIRGNKNSISGYTEKWFYKRRGAEVYIEFKDDKVSYFSADF